MLELTDLVRRYGDVVALDGISFSVAPGQLFGFVGLFVAVPILSLITICVQEFWVKEIDEIDEARRHPEIALPEPLGQDEPVVRSAS